MTETRHPKPKTLIHVICGPTASGKSAKALELARETGGVIINCDSVQLYDGLPLLTAQPTDEDKAQAPHELYGVLAPDDVTSAGDYRELAAPIINNLLANGQTPILCGGTGLYIKTLMEGLSPIPDIPNEIREATIEAHNTLGPEKFYAELEGRDPVMAARFHANHKARIMRAWEVLEATGKSLAEWQKIPKTPPPAHWSFKVHKIIPERAILHERCNTRFLHMIENGAIEEAEEFSKTYHPSPITHTPLTKALGYAEILQYLRGEIDRNEMISRAQGITRRYAKRQITWFKNQL